MSLVAAYGSSDDESEDEDEVEESESVVQKVSANNLLTAGSYQNGNISDEDEYIPTDIRTNQNTKSTTFALSLPKPKNTDSTNTNAEDSTDDDTVLTFGKLPLPKSASNKTVIQEEDDEFLHKKASKSIIKITIPSLNEFHDVNLEINKKNNVNTKPNPKGCGLLNILPKAKSEQNFAKISNEKPIGNEALKVLEKTNLSKTVHAFIPDTVRNRRPAHNTEGVDGIQPAPRKQIKVLENQKPKAKLVDCSDSEGSDDESGSTSGDFFSLNSKMKLPEISPNEITAMVAKRAAKMAAATTNYLSAVEIKSSDEQMQEEKEEGENEATKRQHENELDPEAVHALIGSSAKRQRNQQENIQIMDISSNEVLPSHDEWMRTALATSTAYQPTGVLKDDEPAAGTRRKHQITYLAHKAKANEAELQAMWAVNRQNRRAAQGKYGF